MPRVLPTLTVLLLCAACSIASAQTTAKLPPEVSTRLDQIAALLSSQEVDCRELFTPGFLQQVPEPKVRQIVAVYYNSCGKVVSQRVLSVEGLIAHVEFITSGSKSYTVKLSVESKSGKVAGLLLSSPEPVVKSLKELTAMMAKLPGTAAMLVVRHGKDKPQTLASLNADKPLAIGSTFKLYVLAELGRRANDKTLRWKDTIELQPLCRSYPSGTLQDWPAGAPLTCHTLASLMISQSDNTATDQLIHFLGREAVEKNLSAAGHGKPQLNRPFLTTLELFKLKSNDALAKRYEAADEKARRQLLSGDVAHMGRNKVDMLRLAGPPNRTQTLEWFATAEDIDRLLIHLRDVSEKGKPAAAVRGILGINPGLSARETFAYIGFKGGMEPGVLNMSYLLQCKDGQWLTVVATWNNPADEGINLTTFDGMVQRAAQLAAGS